MKLPNFFIIGAARSATSSLYFYLKQHPDIYMSPDKEAQFFGFFGTSRSHKSKYKTLEEYAQLFEGAGDHKIIGEATPTYLALPESAEAIHELCPDAKLLVSLRDPVERAYSYYEMSKSKGREKTGSFEEWIEGNSFWLQQGGYYEHLKRYIDLFGREKLMVVLFDDINKAPEDTIERIHEFLGVKVIRPDSRPFVYNRGGSPKNPVAAFIYKATTNSRLNRMLRPIIPPSMVKFVHAMRSKSMQRSEMNEGTRKKLKEFFREDIQKTQDLLGMNLERWLT